MASQGVASMFALALLLGAFASIPQSDYLSLSFLFFFSLLCFFFDLLHVWKIIRYI